jgi:hypothetical protein
MGADARISSIGTPDGTRPVTETSAAGEIVAFLIAAMPPSASYSGTPTATTSASSRRAAAESSTTEGRTIRVPTASSRRKRCECRFAE